MDNNKMIAVSWSDYETHGCVNCGCEYCYTGNVHGCGTNPVTCGECGTDFVILADGREKSAFGFGEEAYYPELQDHPRKGILKHDYVKPDVRPEDGEGEFWSPRGIGYDLSGFVKSRQAGVRIVEMVKQIVGEKAESWLDYRESEPNWIQVKIQSEDGFDLKKLGKLCKDGIITKSKLIKSLTEEKAAEVLENSKYCKSPDNDSIESETEENKPSIEMEVIGGEQSSDNILELLNLTISKIDNLDNKVSKLENRIVKLEAKYCGLGDSITTTIDGKEVQLIPVESGRR